MGYIPFAEYYYNSILKNYPDLLIKGNSIHFLCLRKLIKMVKNPEYRIDYYKELIERFSNQFNNLGPIYYFLAEAYEEVGEWDLAIEKYRAFIQSNSAISGIHNAQKKVREKIKFYDSDRKWVENLVGEIKDAIRKKNIGKLDRYRAKTNFFTMSWEQEEYNENLTIQYVIGSFLLASNVTVKEEIDIDSNTQEAYLKTENWTYRIRTWYFYFRRVDFGKDPEINGGWEWTGIYFGKKL
jgi:tetratricopeptide (TPR) repeat protein